MNLQKEYKERSKNSNLIMAFSVAIGIAPIFLVMLIVRQYKMQQLTTSSLLMYVALITICQITKAVLYGVSIKKAHDSAYSSLVEIRLDIIKHLKKMSLSFFQKRKTGDLTNIINHDVEQIEVFLAHAFPDIIVASLVPVMVVIGLLFVDWRLALALACTVPIMSLLNKAFRKLWGKLFKQYFVLTGKLSADLLEYIATMPVVKAFSKDEKRTAKILAAMNRYNKWVKKMNVNVALPMAIIGLFVEGGIIVMAVVGSFLLSQNAINSEQFIIAVLLGGLFISSFAQLPTFQHKRIVFGRATDSINTILGVKEEARTATDQAVESTKIEFNNVTFSYNQDQQVLSDINLTFAPNSTNALVGESGAGKSTIANLIMGFYRPDTGQVKIGDKDINSMSESEINRSVSIVQQDVFLFNTSIEENIRIGKKDATKEEIIEAAKQAQIHDMIMTLKDGYQTLAGESGAKLSGGEKQRISIARMILKNAPIIILDEATSAIDPYNEYLIQRAIDNLSKNKTLILIAHHLNTIVNADQIIVMENGRIVDKGAHVKLISNCSLYNKMLTEQKRVDEWEIKEVV